MRFILLFTLGGVALCLQAQIPANTIGANPLRLKWQQINTDKVQVVFPQGNEIRAQRVANVAHYLWDRHNTSIGNRMHKVTILLQNQPVVPNGFVTVGPFRSEFNLTPPQFNIATDWLDQLAIHEYRHIKQFGNSRYGLTRLARSIFGSWAWGGFAATAMPRWFFEGDATVQETALTRTGRGRLPAFTMEQRSLVLDGVDYGYEKAAAGSYKNFVPNWYSLGYYMVGYGRETFGDTLWTGVVHDAVRYKGLFFPFSNALKKRTGLNTKSFYQAMRQDLSNKWKDSPNMRVATDIRPANLDGKTTITHYTNPRWINDNDLVVEKRGYNLLPVFIRLYPDGKEEKLTSAGLLFSPPETTLSHGNGRLVWSELGFDIRRSNRNFSVIRSYEMLNGTKRDISLHSKYFAPDITYQGDRIVTVEVAENGHCQLVILDPADGSVLTKIPNPEGYFFQFPRWTPGAQSIVVIGQARETQAIYLVDPESGALQTLTPPTSDQLSHPEVTPDLVYFSAAYSGINQIYSVSLNGGSIYQMSNDPVGAFQPAVSPDGQTLAYSAFRRQGFDIIKIPVDPQPPVIAPLEMTKIPTYAETVSRQEGGTIVDAVPGEVFPVGKFNKLSGLINFHSWLPQLDPPLVGASILSDNKFGTMSIDAGALYNLNEGVWTFDANLRYAELFPVISLGYQYANRSTRFYNLSPENDSLVRYATYVEDWKENKFSANVAIPLNFSKGNAVHRLDLSGGFDRFSVDPMGNLLNDPDKVTDTLLNVGPGNSQVLDELYLEPLAKTDLNALDLRLSWRLFRRQALQHLAPRWGIVTDTRYRRTFGNDLFFGDNFVTRADIYLPGFSRNHSFYLNLGYQQLDRLDNYRFSNFFSYPRGYGAVGADEIFRLGVNYSLPLAYPDLAIGPLAFLKRIKLNVFGDFGGLKYKSFFADYGGVDQNYSITSAGAELRFDVRFLRLVEVDFGFRYSYLSDLDFSPNGQRHQFDFLLISITE